jgi:hypothetical protein
LNPDVFKLDQVKDKNLDKYNLNIYKRNLYELLTQKKCDYKSPNRCKPIVHKHTKQRKSERQL